jgi:hypothetical protein
VTVWLGERSIWMLVRTASAVLMIVSSLVFTSISISCVFTVSCAIPSRVGAHS